MAQPDYSKIFSCPRCGTMGAIYVLKIAGSQIIVKQRCPKHGGRSFKVPLVQKELLIPYFRNNIFRCYKCGQETAVNQMKVSGPWTLIRGACPIHSNKLPFQKIWTSVYNEISDKKVTQPQITQPETVQPETVQPQPPPNDEKRFCPHCGTPKEGLEKFCSTCGAKLE